jgi:hypothetical protein
MSNDPKFGDIIKHHKDLEKAASQPQSSKAVKTAKGKAVKTASGKAATDRDVSMTIKVPMSLRRHWVSSAKAEGTSISAEVTAFLKKRFPSNH